jgi:hypothetical protein
MWYFYLSALGNLYDNENPRLNLLCEFKNLLESFSAHRFRLDSLVDKAKRSNACSLRTVKRPYDIAYPPPEYVQPG